MNQHVQCVCKEYNLWGRMFGSNGAWYKGSDVLSAKMSFFSNLCIVLIYKNN